MEPNATTATAPERAAGVLLHPISLPGPRPIGDLGGATDRFLDWLEAAGQRAWQVLPLNETGYGASPYGAISSFAGNRLLIALEPLVELGLLDADDVEPPPIATDRVDYAAAEECKNDALRLAWSRFAERADASLAADLETFLDHGTADGWLEDWALFAALKKSFDGAAWVHWPEAIRRRQPEALAAARSRLRDELDFQVFVQFVFYRQWDRVHRQAGRRGIRILGDLPIYPAADSADVWAHQELFDLDADGGLNACAGVPPDYFSPTGQKWGNPLYRWDRHRDDGFDWWARRIGFLLRHVDVLRLDHFRGFAAFWRVPAGAEDASSGSWVEAPGADLFAALRDRLGSLPLVAEDLGVITPDVTALRRRFGFPGMKVLQFAFDEVDSEHLPHHHGADSVVYSGTHDNDTAGGWFAKMAPDARQRLSDYLGCGGDEIHWTLIRAALASVGRLAIIPAQDVLGLESEARMNTPGAAAGNWLWRLAAEDLGEEVGHRLRRQSELTGRLAAATPATTGESPGD